MSFANGQLWVTFNGEIYNYVELRAELESRGHRFRSRSDTEVLLAAFAQWGADCQQRFNGMWAFAIWDSRERALFISRDRFGVKPLFYVVTPHRFAFASELKAFLALADFDVAFDPQVVANRLHDVPMVEAAESSLLQGVRKLPAGHYLRLRRGEAPTIQRWWTTLDHINAVSPAYEEQAEEFRSLFIDACRIRMRSDRRVGTTLSGGLDSSSVVCALSRLGGGSMATDSPSERPLQFAVHTEFPEAQMSERDYAVAAASRAGAVLHLMPLTAQEVLSKIDDVLFAYEGISTLPGVRWFTYRELRRADVPVTIDGDGADELLAGYSSHFQEALRSSSRPFPQVARILGYYRARQGTKYPGSWEDWLHLCGLVARGYADALLRNLPALRKQSRFAAEFPRRAWLRIGATPSLVPALQQDRDPVSKLSPLQRVLYEDFHYRTLPGILRSVDRCSMAHGVEVRSPFLDWRLVCLAFSLPETSKLGAGLTKRILRSAMAGILPPAIEKRTSKIPFEPPIEQWLRGPMRGFLLDNASSRDFLHSPIWNGHAIRDDMEAALRRNDLSFATAISPFVQAMRVMQLFKQRSHAGGGTA